MSINTRYGRPKKLGMIRQTTISLYEKYRETYKLASELANRERISFSELVSISLAEKVERSYPGNPAPPLESYMGGSRAKTLEAKGIFKSLSENISKIKLHIGSEGFRERLKEPIAKDMVKLAKLNRVLREAEYDEIIDEGDKLVYG